MDGYRCLKCGKLHTAAKVNGWGINGVGAGLGPHPVCDATIPVPGFAGAGQVCKGALLPHLGAAAPNADSPSTSLLL